MIDKELVWMGSSRDDLKQFPEPVRYVMGTALRAAQRGGKHPSAKPLVGFGGAGVLEIVDDDDGDTYRAVYTVRMEDVDNVLHAFTKKSKQGRATPRHEMDLVRRRLRAAEALHERRTR
jgi:phage-related protein